MSLPILEAAPGMPAHLVKKASTATLNAPDPSRRLAILQPPEAHAFRLRCSDDTTLDVGDSLFTVIELRHGTAYRILSTTQLDYLDRPRALDHADALIDKLEAVGFVHTERLAHEASQELAEHDEHVRIAEHTAPFGSGSWHAETWLRTTVRKGSKTAELLQLQDDACLVSLVVYDEALRPGNLP